MLKLINTLYSDPDADKGVKIIRAEVDREGDDNYTCHNKVDGEAN